MIRCFQILYSLWFRYFVCVSDFLCDICSILSYNWGIVSFLLLNLKDLPIGEMWFVLGINRLNYVKRWLPLDEITAECLICARIRDCQYFLCFVEYQPCWNSRYIGISAMLVSTILDLDIIFVFIVINWEFTLDVNPFLVGLCCLPNLLWLTVNYVC